MFSVCEGLRKLKTKLLFVFIADTLVARTRCITKRYAKSPTGFLQFLVVTVTKKVAKATGNASCGWVADQRNYQEGGVSVGRWGVGNTGRNSRVGTLLDCRESQLNTSITFNKKTVSY